MSKKCNDAEAYVLFGDRVGKQDLVLDPSFARVFLSGEGFDWLVDFCTPQHMRPHDPHVTWSTLCQTVGVVDEQEPPKRVVKRVVKKTVVRPGAPSEAPPPLRYGRTTSPTVATATKPRAKTSPSRPTKAPAPKPQRVNIGAKLKSAGHRIGDAWWTVADGVRDGSGAAGRATTSRARAVAGWRLPHVNLYLAAMITGASTGLVAVGLGAGALQLFTATRDVSTGGGFWGGLAVIAIGLLCAWIGGLLLAGFGSPTARLTSVLGVIVTTVAIMGLFLDQSQTSAAVLLIPALAATSYALAHWLLTLAEETA